MFKLVTNEVTNEVTKKVKTFLSKTLAIILASTLTVSGITPIPVQAAEAPKVVKIASNPYYTLALLDNATVLSWGDNSKGALGLGDTTVRPSPTLIPSLSGVKDISVLPFGVYNSFAILNNNDLMAWGENSHGQLGLGSTPTIKTPTLTLSGVKKVVQRQYYTIAIMEDGTVQGSGSGGVSQEVPYNGADKYTFKPIAGFSNIVDVVGFDGNDFFIAEDGTVQGLGHNYNGSLGVGTTTPQYTPISIPELTGLKNVATRDYIIYAQMIDGSLKGWGRNENDDFKNGAVPVLRPIVVSELSGVKQVISSFIVMDDGTVKSWGKNTSYGALGLGDTDVTKYYATPTTIPDLTDVDKLFFGSGYVLALLFDGSVKGWGGNTAGYLGLGDKIRRETPTLIPSLSGVKNIIVGQIANFAFLTDSSIEAWGNNMSAQLGVGYGTGAPDYGLFVPTVVPDLISDPNNLLQSGEMLVVAEEPDYTLNNLTVNESPVQNKPTTVTVDIVNNSTTDALGMTIELTSDSVIVATKVVDLPGNIATQVTFDWTPTNLGSQALSVSLGTGTTSQVVDVQVPLSSAKTLNTFGIPELGVSGVIDEETKTVDLTVPHGTDITALTPSITIAEGATSVPANNEPQNFTNPVTYTVTAEDDTTETYTVTVTTAPEPLSTEKDVTTFDFTDLNVSGVVNTIGNTITLTVPYGADVTALTPTITLSTDATISPLATTPQDFTSPVTYTVTAEDGTTKSYTVTVTIAPEALSTEKEVTAFSFANSGVTGEVNTLGNTVTLSVPYGTDITALVPTISLSDGASVSPLSNVPQDFTNPITYTITAEDGSIQTYTVTVEVALQDPVVEVPSGGDNNTGSNIPIKEETKEVTVTKEPEKQRIAGKDRVDTSLAVAQEMLEKFGAFDSVVVADAYNYPDALSASVLADKLNAPILLVGKDTNTNAKVMDFITQNITKNSEVVIAGGTGVVSVEVESQLENMSYDLTRLGGTDRYETNQLINNYLNIPIGTPLILASGENFADALSVSPIAAMNGYPIILTDKDELSPYAKAYLDKIKPSEVFIIGGTGVIASKLETSLGTKTTRLGGADRYETSLKVAEHFNTFALDAVITTGLDFADALTAGVFASKLQAPIILSDATNLEPIKIGDSNYTPTITPTKKYLVENKFSNFHYIGGETVNPVKY